MKLIKPYYYEGNRGNKPYDLELMLRIYTLQNLYDLSDDATHFEVIDSRIFSDFYNISSRKGGIIRREKEKSSVRSKEVHFFGVIKSNYNSRNKLWGLRKIDIKIKLCSFKK